jgi:hypothetical protein
MILLNGPIARQAQLRHRFGDRLQIVEPAPMRSPRPPPLLGLDRGPDDPPLAVIIDNLERLIMGSRWPAMSTRKLGSQLTGQARPLVCRSILALPRGLIISRPAFAFPDKRS